MSHFSTGGRPGFVMVVQCTEISSKFPTLLTRFTACTITDFQHQYVQRGVINGYSDVSGDLLVVFGLIFAELSGGFNHNKFTSRAVLPAVSALNIKKMILKI